MMDEQKTGFKSSPPTDSDSEFTKVPNKAMKMLFELAQHEKLDPDLSILLFPPHDLDTETYKKYVPVGNYKEPEAPIGSSRFDLSKSMH